MGMARQNFFHVQEHVNILETFVNPPQSSLVTPLFLLQSHHAGNSETLTHWDEPLIERLSFSQRLRMY